MASVEEASVSTHEVSHRSTHRVEFYNGSRELSVYFKSNILEGYFYVLFLIAGKEAVALYALYCIKRICLSPDC